MPFGSISFEYRLIILRLLTAKLEEKYTKEQATSCASWFLPYNNTHLYFDKVFYVYVSFSFYVTFLPSTIMAAHFFVH
jgi:hypothetical protein